MNEYRVFDFASLRNSHLKNGFWGRRTENYMEIIESQLSALLCETNSARLLTLELHLEQSKESLQEQIGRMATATSFWRAVSMYTKTPAIRV